MWLIAKAYMPTHAHLYLMIPYGMGRAQVQYFHAWSVLTWFSPMTATELGEVIADLSIDQTLHFLCDRMPFSQKDRSAFVHA